MCLAAGSLKTPKKTAGFGWKVLIQEGKRFSTPYMGTRVRTDIWLKAKKRKLLVSDFDFRNPRHYESGFHIFTTKTAAQKYATTFPWAKYRIVVKVEYRDAHTVGLDGPMSDLRTIVAREMRILPPSEVS